MAIYESKLNVFMGNFAATIVAGDKLGLCKALAQGPGMVEMLASRTQRKAARPFIPGGPFNLIFQARP